jgi:hypothetical protein
MRRLDEPQKPVQSALATSSEGRCPMDIGDGLSAALRILALVGADRVALVTVARDRVSFQPTHLKEGEQIARELGLVVPVDRRIFVPGNTLWTGELDGFEVQVRSVLRRAVAR